MAGRARRPPKGSGIVPNITSGEGGIGDWSESDIAYYLETGFTPDFDSVGGRHGRRPEEHGAAAAPKTARRSPPI